MRILADENMSAHVVARLRVGGHDVRWAKETDPSETDNNLLALAIRQRRTLVTYDTDFGELVNRHYMTAPYGVVQFRVHDHVPSEVEWEFVFNTINIWDRWPPGVWTIQIRHRLT